MSSTGAGYDQSVSTFSPDGRLYQVEYAMKAIETSGTAVGVKCTDGIILGVEKLLAAKMLVPGSARRIAHVDEHIGVAVSGWYPDARLLISRGRDEARAYRSNFGTSIPPRTIADRLAAFTHMGTIYWYLRPFGASILVAGYDAETKCHELYCVEPTGMGLRYHGMAIGKGARSAKTDIEKYKLTDMTCEEALGYVAKILYSVHDVTKDKPMEMELSWISAATGWKHAFVPAERQAAAEAWAKAQIEAEERGDDDDDDE